MHVLIGFTNIPAFWNSHAKQCSCDRLWATVQGKRYKIKKMLQFKAFRKVNYFIFYMPKYGGISFFA